MLALSSVLEWERKKKRNALSPNAEGVRQGAEDRAMQLEGLGSAVSSPSGSGRQMTFGVFLV